MNVIQLMYDRKTYVLFKKQAVLMCAHKILPTDFYEREIFSLPCDDRFLLLNLYGLISIVYFKKAVN